MNSGLFANNSVQTRPHVLMVTHVLPYPPAAGNEIRIYKMLKWFRHKGYGVTLVLKPLDDTEVTNECVLGLREVVDNLHIFDNRVIPVRADVASARVPRPVDTDIDDPMLSQIQDGFCPAWFVEEVAAVIAALQPEVVIAQYVFTSRILALQECGLALRVIDAHDLFCRKQATVEQYGIKNYGLSLTDDQERRLLNRSDVVLAIQRVEQVEIAKLVPERKVLLASFDLEVHTADPRRVGQRIQRARYAGFSRLYMAAGPRSQSERAAACDRARLPRSDVGRSDRVAARLRRKPRSRIRTGRRGGQPVPGRHRSQDQDDRGPRLGQGARGVALGGRRPA
jgi:hypothetical protein